MKKSKKLEIVQEHLNKHPWYGDVYIDYRESLTDRQVGFLLAGEMDSFYEDVWETWWESEVETAHWAVAEAIKDSGIPYRDENALARTLIDMGLEVPTKLDINQLARQTYGGYYVLELDIYHSTPGWLLWREDYSELKDELKALGVNPAGLRDYFPDMRWYNAPTRTDPILSHKSICEAWINCVSPGGWYAMLDPRDTLQLALNGKLKGKMVLKKGARIVIHDYFNGASSIDQFTERDWTVNVDGKVSVDGRYGIQDCCAYCNFAWSSVLEVLGI